MEPKISHWAKSWTKSYARQERAPCSFSVHGPCISTIPLSLDDFFETCKYGVSDADTQATWQHLAGLKCTSINPALLTDERLLRGRSLNDEQTPKVSHLPTGDASISNLETRDKNVLLDDVDVEFPPDTKEQASKDAGLPSRDAQRVRSRAPKAGGLQISKSQRPRASGEPTRASYGAPQGAKTSELPPQSTYKAGTSTRGKIRRMTRAMADSVSQQGFYGQSNMHYMAAKAVITGQTDEDQEHDEHLALQERMRHPIAFHAEMMGDVMYLQQALRQPDASQFVDAVISEVNGHVTNKNWALIKRSEVPEDADVVPSV